jgi:hypothetical protein
VSAPATPPPPTLVAVRDRREQVTAQLTDAFARDDIDVDELEHRLDLAHAARSIAELDAVAADLPAPPTGTRWSRRACARSLAPIADYVGRFVEGAWVWSPDGRRLANPSSTTTGEVGTWVISADGGEPLKVSDRTGRVNWLTADALVIDGGFFAGDPGLWRVQADGSGTTSLWDDATRVSVVGCRPTGATSGSTSPPRRPTRGSRYSTSIPASASRSAPRPVGRSRPMAARREARLTRPPRCSPCERTAPSSAG